MDAEQFPHLALVLPPPGQALDLRLRLLVGVDALLHPAGDQLFYLADAVLARLPAVLGGHEQIAGRKAQAAVKVEKALGLVGGEGAA